jgi:hypothetical protein
VKAAASSRRRTWLRRAGLVLGGLLVGLLLAEAVGRIDGLALGNDLVFMAPMSYPQDIYVQGGGMNYPNPAFTGTIHSFGYSVSPRFTAWGTRGPEPTRGGRTWLSLGDSFTIALQVEEEQTYSALLARSEGVQVLNAGVDGYSTWKEGVRAVQLGRNFPPEVVIFAFFTGNDFFDNRQAGSPAIGQVPPGPGEAGAPKFSLPRVGVTGAKLPVWAHFIRDHSVLAAHYWSWSETRRARSGVSPNARRFRDELRLFTTEGPGRAGPDVASTEAALQYAKAAGDWLHARTVVAVIPPALVMDDDVATRTFRSVGLDDATPDLDSAQKLAVDAARKAGVEVCDLLPALRAASNAGENPYLPFDGHLSFRGHEVVAAEIQRCTAARPAG